MAISFPWPVAGTGELYAGNEWDTVKIGDYQLPGLCEIPDLKSERDVHTQKSAETDGAKKLWRGYKSAEFTIRVRMWTKEQFSKLDEVLAKIWSRPDKKEPEAMPISHPQCTRLGIKQVLVVGVLGVTKGSAPGEFVQTLKISEYRPPVHKVAAKPKAAKKKNQNDLFDEKKPSKDQTGPGSDTIKEINPKLKSKG